MPEIPVRKSINLLIKRDEDSKELLLLKKFLPIVAVVCIGVFLIGFVISFVYTNIHVTQFTALKKQIEGVERQIGDKKNIEQNYVITSNRLNSINQVLSGSSSLSPLLSQVANLQGEGITIASSGIDEKGSISIAVTADSADSLEKYVDTLISKEDVDHIYSKITSLGMIRDKKGKYTVSFVFFAALPKQS